MKFFIPDAEPDKVLAVAAELKKGNKRPIYSMTYTHEGSKFVVTVGEPRKEYKRKKGPRGGHIPNAGVSKVGSLTGNPVFLIVDTGSVIEVFSKRPDSWAYPSLVSLASALGSIEYFDF